MTTDSANLPQIQLSELTLPIEGMTCASCSNRVERFLRKTGGVVEANVNLATEQALVRFDPAAVGRDELSRAVEAAGVQRPGRDRRRRRRWAGRRRGR